ncbi:MAG: ABC transporter ATP-binding protein [Opitutales bacterium]|jgi:NitT/TauT family transport system ATP-binding protein
MPDGPSVTLKGISKRFGEGPTVLQDIDLSVRDGEIVSIVGPSGCGKSTLLRIIAKLLAATTGEISYGGNKVDPAFIFQEATLLPWATVRDNIALPSRLKGISREHRHELANEWAVRVGLKRALDLYPRQLSGGMKMRVSIARALSRFPSLLLLDEPFGALDAINRNRLNEELLDLHEASRWTAFFVTHSVSEAVFLSNRIVIMGNNPGYVSAIVDNPLPYPRNAQTRESLEFQQRVAEATARLHEVLPR